MHDHIQARRDVLAAQKDGVELAYARLEAQIAQSQAELALRQRQLDRIAGAIVELDALLALPMEELPSDSSSS